MSRKELEKHHVESMPFFFFLISFILFWIPSKSSLIFLSRALIFYIKKHRKKPSESGKIEDLREFFSETGYEFKS